MFGGQAEVLKEECRAPGGCESARHAENPEMRRQVLRGQRRHRRAETACGGGLLGGDDPGGLGAAVATLTAQHLPTHLRILGVPRSFAPTGSTAFLLDYFGLTAEHIAAAARDIMTHASR